MYFHSPIVNNYLDVLAILEDKPHIKASEIIKKKSLFKTWSYIPAIDTTQQDIYALRVLGRKDMFVDNEIIRRYITWPDIWVYAFIHYRDTGDTQYAPTRERLLEVLILLSDAMKKSMIESYEYSLNRPSDVLHRKDHDKKLFEMFKDAMSRP